MKSVLLLFLMVAVPLSVSGQDTVVSSPSQPLLGDPLTYQELPSEADSSSADTQQLSVMGVPADNLGGWSVDTSNRQVSRSFYNSIYSASENTPDGWVGDVGSCSAGVTSTDFKNSVLARVNFFRAMAGVPATVVFSSVYSGKSQQAALMMSRNNTLSHTPPDTWECYTVDGAEAAGSSNLSLGSYGWDAVSGQIRDDGSNNAAVGHRRWLLYPQTQIMGSGDVPATSGYSAANSLWVFDDNIWGSRPVTRDGFIAWPPPGYVPYPLIPTRWSFSYAGADFSGAAVSMICGGVSQTLSLEPISFNMGENTLVWYRSEPWGAVAADLSCEVSVTGIAQAPQTSYSYLVTIIDPLQASGLEETVEISGSHTAVVGQQGSWDLAAVSFADSYEVLQASYKAAVPEGAEAAPPPVLDFTDGSYALIDSAAAANGTYGFHLAQPTVASDRFEIQTTFVPSSASTLVFNARLGYSTTDQQAVVQISWDDGKNWDTLFSRIGSGGAGDTVFQQYSVPLSAYSERPVRLRVVYGYKDGQYGSYYPCVTAGCGFLIDDITVTEAVQLQAEVVEPVASGTVFRFTPQEKGAYLFSARAVAWAGYPGLEWNRVFYLDAADTFPWSLFLPSVFGGQ